MHLLCLLAQPIATQGSSVSRNSASRSGTRVAGHRVASAMTLGSTIADASLSPASILLYLEDSMLVVDRQRPPLVAVRSHLEQKEGLSTLGGA